MAAPLGNKYTQEWTLDNAMCRFEDALKYATENESCLCIQDAILQSGIPSRTFYYLADNHEVLRDIKQEINDLVIIRVNKLALDRLNPCPAAPAIWRMKQLGERDEQHVHQTGTMKQSIVVADPETKKAIEDMKQKFEEE